MDDWRDIEGKSGCYCVICHEGVKEEYIDKSGGVCGNCSWDDPVLGQSFEKGDDLTDMVVKYLQDMADRGDEAAKRLLDMLREEPDE